MNRKAILLPAIAAALTILGICSRWSWNAVYHGFYPAHEVQAVIAAGMAVAFFAGALILHFRIFSPALLRSMLLIVVLFAIRPIIKGLLHSAPIYPYLNTIAYFLGAALTICAFYKLKRSSAFSMTFDKALIVFWLIFTVSFPLAGKAIRLPESSVFGLHFLDQPSWTPRGKLVLLLDETSPEEDGPIIAALQKNGLYIQNNVVAEAGTDTDYAIPAMFTGKNFDGAADCGTTIVCHDNLSLDFSRLHAAADHKTDIIGSWHPYCAIQGLRFCIRYAGEDVGEEPVWKSLACDTFVRFLPAAWRHAACDEMSYPLANKLRRDMEASLFAAPFWQEGGTLYAHLAVPHPPGPSPKSLKEEYEENIDQAAGLVDRVAARLRERFGDDFILFITADHPLRLDLWCTFRYYDKADCRMGLPANNRQVPAIIASPRAGNWQMPPTDLSIFADK